MEEILELVKQKVMHGLHICLVIAAVILLGIAIWRVVMYFLTRSRVESAKQIYSDIRLGEPKEKAVMLFREYLGSSDHYTEEALLPSGKRELVLCLLFAFGRGETGEIRLTYVDDVLVQKQQNGIW